MWLMNAEEVKHIERETDEEGQRKRGSLRSNRFNRHAGDSLRSFFFYFYFFYFFVVSRFCNATQTSCHTKRHFGRCRFFSKCVIINYMKLTCFFFLFFFITAELKCDVRREKERQTDRQMIRKMQLNAIMQKARSSTHIYLYMGSCRPMLTYDGSRITINTSLI